MAAFVGGLDELMACVAGRFARVESRATCRRMMLGMLSEVPSKNCWTLAEHVGDKNPHVMQHFLSRAAWDDAGAGEDLRDYVVDRLGDSDAVVVLDETGDLKKGSHTVGVRRQYTGTAGRIENAQVAVYLGYGTSRGYTLVDVYGDDPKLREFAESRELSYVMAIGCNRHVTTMTGRTARADEIVADLSKRKWHTLSAGDGAKGPRTYDWAWLPLSDAPGSAPGHRWLLARRNRTTAEIAYYRCFSTRLPRLGALARVAGRRWSIEVNFQHAKNLVGLDQHQVRTWTSWRRWTLLGMLALALLTTLSAAAASQPAADGDGIIALTRNEIRHLIALLIITPTRTMTHVIAWSDWRRRHQHQARTSHYQRKAAEAA